MKGLVMEKGTVLDRSEICERLERELALAHEEGAINPRRQAIAQVECWFVRLVSQLRNNRIAKCNPGW